MGPSGADFHPRLFSMTGSIGSRGVSAAVKGLLRGQGSSAGLRNRLRCFARKSQVLVVDSMSVPDRLIPCQITAFCNACESYCVELIIHFSWSVSPPGTGTVDIKAKVICSVL